MKDIFTRNVELGDTVLIMADSKNFRIEIVEKFYGKTGFYTDYNRLIKSDFLILKRGSGEVYFNSKGNPLNTWATSNENNYTYSESIKLEEK